MQFYQKYKPNKLYNWGSTQGLAQVLSKDLTLRATLTSKYQNNFGAIQIAVSRNLHSLNMVPLRWSTKIFLQVRQLLFARQPSGYQKLGHLWSEERDSVMSVG